MYLCALILLNDNVLFKASNLLQLRCAKQPSCSNRQSIISGLSEKKCADFNWSSATDHVFPSVAWSNFTGSGMVTEVESVGFVSAPYFRWLWTSISKRHSVSRVILLLSVPTSFENPFYICNLSFPLLELTNNALRIC